MCCSSCVKKQHLLFTRLFIFVQSVNSTFAVLICTQRLLHSRTVPSGTAVAAVCLSVCLTVRSSSPAASLPLAPGARGAAEDDEEVARAEEEGTEDERATAPPISVLPFERSRLPLSPRPPAPRDTPSSRCLRPLLAQRWVADPSARK